MKFYEGISKIIASKINIAYSTPEDNAMFLRMIDLSKLSKK